MTSEAFKTVLGGYSKSAVDRSLQELEARHQEECGLLESREETLRLRQEELSAEVAALTEVLSLPEMSARFLDMADARIGQAEDFFKTMMEKDKQVLQQEHQNRQLSHDIRQQQIETSIQQCKQQFQSMMANLNAMIKMPSKKTLSVKPNLVVLEGTGSVDERASEVAVHGQYDPERIQYLYVIGQKAGKDLYLDNGQRIVEAGDRITYEQARLAHEEGKLAWLVRDMIEPENKKSI